MDEHDTELVNTDFDAIFNNINARMAHYCEVYKLLDHIHESTTDAL